MSSSGLLIILEFSQGNLAVGFFSKYQPFFSNTHMEVDHIIPVSLGGLHHQDNLQYLTPDENKRKGNRVAYSVYPRQF